MIGEGEVCAQSIFQCFAFNQALMDSGLFCFPLLRHQPLVTRVLQLLHVGDWVADLGELQLTEVSAIPSGVQQDLPLDAWILQLHDDGSC